jgi:hypothetical protein
MTVFNRATTKQSRLRLALIGPAGAGKTYSALRIAAGLGDKVALIDTERGSASKYAGEFVFDVCELESHHPKSYIDAIHAAGAAGYEVLILDSLSHAWAGRDGALELVDKAGKRGAANSFSAWRDVTPLHNALVDAILTSRCHVIATMRSKMAYVQEKDDRGKTVIRKVGLQPVQREGMEFEFDVIADLDTDHNLSVAKTRCSAIDGEVYHRPGPELGKTLAAWLGQGEAPAAEVSRSPTTITLDEWSARLESGGMDPLIVAHFFALNGRGHPDEWGDAERLAKMLAWVLSEDGRARIAAWGKVGSDSDAPHHPEFEPDRARFMARLGDLGLKYEDVRSACLDLGIGKPSTWPTVGREWFYGALLDERFPDIYSGGGVDHPTRESRSIPAALQDTRPPPRPIPTGPSPGRESPPTCTVETLYQAASEHGVLVSEVDLYFYQKGKGEPGGWDGPTLEKARAWIAETQAQPIRDHLGQLVRQVREMDGSIAAKLPSEPDGQSIAAREWAEDKRAFLDACRSRRIAWSRMLALGRVIVGAYPWGWTRERRRHFGSDLDAGALPLPLLLSEASTVAAATDSAMAAGVV